MTRAGLSGAAAPLALAAALFCGCATPPRPYDYTNFRAHRPRSILVLPPMNESTDVRATYGYLSTITRPLAELGYYVFPVEVVDQFLKENGMPGAGEMWQAPLDKLGSVFGADAVLYVKIDQYGTKYEVLSSVTVVRARAKLIDTKTGLLLWDGGVAVERGSGSGGGGLLGALVTAAVSQAMNSTADNAHPLSRQANWLLFQGRRGYGDGPGSGAGGRGLPYGPYRPEAAPEN